MIGYDAIVLAGGGGRRMGGVDKGAVLLHGVPLLEHVVSGLSTAHQVLVVGSSLVPAGCVDVREPTPHGGPVSGVAAAIAEVDSDWVVLAGCDQPFIGEVLATLLDRASRSRADGVVFHPAGGQPQPLGAAYRTESLRQTLQAATSTFGVPLRGVLDQLQLEAITAEPRGLADVDTWQDLRVLESWGPRAAPYEEL